MCCKDTYQFGESENGITLFLQAPDTSNFISPDCYLAEKQLPFLPVQGVYTTKQTIWNGFAKICNKTLSTFLPLL